MALLDVVGAAAAVVAVDEAYKSPAVAGVSEVVDPNCVAVVGLQ